MCTIESGLWQSSQEQVFIQNHSKRQFSAVSTATGTTEALSDLLHLC